MEMKPKIVMGIDPQPTLIAVCVLDQYDKIYWWENIYLLKRNNFSTAQLWQEYIFQSSRDIVEKGKSLYPGLSVAVEQQRGRIKSIIEQGFLSACMELKIPRKILHPGTWKKACGFKSAKGNKNNKKLSEILGVKRLKDYNPELLEKNKDRYHDLTDAYFIAKSYIVLVSK